MLVLQEVSCHGLLQLPRENVSAAVVNKTDCYQISYPSCTLLSVCELVLHAPSVVKYKPCTELCTLETNRMRTVLSFIYMVLICIW